MSTIPTNQERRREWLIKALLADMGIAHEMPTGPDNQRALLRALFNVRPPKEASSEFLRVQDAYLQARLRERGVVHVGDPGFLASPDGLLLWQGDITRLAADAVMNAANDQMLGCFTPGHHCIDNAIHTFAGVQLRLECARIMQAQGHAEPTGQAKVTPAYNLPSKYVVHTVGPIAEGGRPTRRDCELLASSYRAVLDAACTAGCESVALCCLSTGVFGFPRREAARIAVDTVRAWQAETETAKAGRRELAVVFTVFLDDDLRLYRELLGIHAGQ